MIYPPHHPSVMEPAAEICRLAKPVFAERAELTFNIVKSEIYFEKRLFSEESIKQTELIHHLMERGINSISLEPGVTPSSITVFFSLINQKELGDRGAMLLRERLREQGVVGIRFETLIAFEMMKDTYEIIGTKELTGSLKQSYDEALDCMKTVSQDVFANKSISVKSVLTVVASLMENFMGDRDAVMGLMTIRTYDEHLFHHSVNVAVMCLLIGSKLPVSRDTVQMIGAAGLLHDVGKLKIPKEILDKPGKLSEWEWQIMWRHPIEGAKILMRNEKLGQFPVLAALEHHVGYDMSGYPTLKEKNCPHMVSRIVEIADVYEAMTANRSYRKPQDVHIAMKTLIDGFGKEFDPLLVKLLLNSLGAFPPGSVVRLKDGETAVVVEPNDGNPFYPKVRLFDGTDNGSAEQVVIDTISDPARFAITGIASSPKR
jgi:HD-GYP domain-containing protein (c-di-GMP phosphodiesterase class II)